MKLNGLSAPDSAGHRRRRAALATAALMAGFTMASSEAAFAHHYSNGTTCDDGYAKYAAAPPPLAAPEGGIRLGFGPNGFRDIGGQAWTDTQTAVNVYGRGKPAAGLQIAKFCRWFDDEAKPSTQHYDGGGPFAPGPDGWAENPVGHTYTQPDEYEVFAQAVDTQAPQAAWSQKAKQLIYVNGRPTASFTFSPAKPKPGQEVTFTSTSKDHPVENRALKTYVWDLDGNDSFESSGATVKRTYTGSSSVVVSHTVRDDKDGRPLAPFTRPVSPNDTPPVPSFSYAPSAPQAEQAVTFTASATDADGDEIVKYEWDFDGDGIYAAGSASASYAFPRSGVFPVMLKATDDRGGVGVFRGNISVSALPTATPAAAAAPVVSSTTRGTTASSQARLAARFGLRSSRTRAGARLRTLTVAAPPGATVKVRCKGSGCKIRAQTLRSKGKALRLTRFQRSYKAGAVIEVFVTKSGTVGRYVRIKVRKGKAPLRTDLCVRSGRASRC